MFGFRRGTRSDEQVCRAQVRHLLKMEEQLRAGVQKNPKLAAKLQATQTHIRGEMAKCMQVTRQQRKESLYKSRAERAASKAEIARQQQEIKAARHATRMQQLEYRAQQAQVHQARVEAGLAAPRSTLLAGGAIAALGAALFFL